MGFSVDGCETGVLLSALNKARDQQPILDTLNTSIIPIQPPVTCLRLLEYELCGKNDFSINIIIIAPTILYR